MGGRRDKGKEEVKEAKKRLYHRRIWWNFQDAEIFDFWSIISLASGLGCPLSKELISRKK